MQSAPVRFTQQQLEQRARERPPEYVQEILRHARQVPGGYEIDRNLIEDLRVRYCKPMPPIPRLVDLLSHFGAAMADWHKAGYPIVTDPELAARLEACSHCDEWKPGIVAGCRKCGCTALKLWLKTEKCRDGRWPDQSGA